MSQIPKSFQGILWSTPTDQLDIHKHKSYIIHHVLMFGDFSQIKWLFNIYTITQIQKIFLENPYKIYTKPALNYISIYILDLPKTPPFEKYVNTIYKNA